LRVNESNNDVSNAIPDDALEALARCLYPAILAYFESESGKREFAEWQMSKASLNEALGIDGLSGMKSIDRIRLAG